ncbi:SDR family NAD(P)-dependent oxidoreductase [Rhizobium sp. L1K21]|uniref:SDR family NAD(P)-dependent oxidoreductase n=1 Tax=Rhizobium sp. L1K21 TaxID=2954933 RepID=UPI002092DDF6|nr:SDR family NAD(P)-dependent oxidoreductase [Rhizobium sp. L1K21]MCO6188556.1 SDR family NAD(P)-dependent oxidoreductase [Rhizobium sp. L1K21]
MMVKNVQTLRGKVAIVTGSGRGIGRAIAHLMASRDAQVVINDIDGDQAQVVCNEIRGQGGKATAFAGPVGPTSTAEDCVAKALSEFGRLDVVCTNAGNLRDRVLWNTSDDDFDSVIETHLRGTFTFARAAARHFRQAGQGGRLILISSLAGQRGNFGQTAYSAAKAGIAAFARTWSMELAKAQVTVNAIVPNALTRMTATMPLFAEHAEALERGEAIPEELRKNMGIGSANDIAPLAAFLASDAAAQITGQCIGIGGDRLSLWSHPAEKRFALMDGGWTPEAIETIWRDEFEAEREEVGIKFDS